ncbi:MAG TPA: hypothetical protein VGI98_08205, partial [Candidatus Limnocylindrales bacterium]
MSGIAVPTAGRFAAAARWLLVGGLVALGAQVLLPLGQPLYDGVSVVPPYRYLQPGDNQVGQPTSFAADVPVASGRSPQFTAATLENPPQAQLIALDGVFSIAAGQAAVHVSIQPVTPAAPLTQGSLSGNVYRIAVTDAAGKPLALAGSERPTLAMRSAQPLADAAIFWLDNGTWKRLDTIANASLSIYTAQPATLGDFAVVDLAAGGITATTLVVGATVAVVIAAIAIWAIRTWMRSRLPPPPPAGRGA